MLSRLARKGGGYITQERGGAMDRNERIDALALRDIGGLGDRSFKLLIDAFGSASKVFAASPETLRTVAGGGQRLIKLLAVTPDRMAARERLERAEQSGFWTRVYGEPGYPASLAVIADPPAVLYGMGPLLGEERGAVAIVGSRKATTHGLRTARRLGREMAAQELCVVSGLADGVDGAAHWGALDGDGRTVAVFGARPDVIYPRKNEKLSEAIVEGGVALVSEHPPGVKPDARHFPRRNRIISGLCLGVIVVEAAQRSGSLITASVALEQGREVFAVPGMAGSPSARGTNNLLRQGARLVESVEDVLEEIHLPPRAAPVAESSLEIGEEARKPSGTGGAVWQVLEDTPLDIDEIAQKCKLSAAETAAGLMELTLTGFADEWPGKRYSRTGA